MQPQQALADLKQISVQIVHALIADASGHVVASTVGDASAEATLARTAQSLWEAGERARRDLGRDELAQLEVATPEGSVFLVRDDARTIVATTSADPTVGLVFYDLKACLRSVAESAAGPAATPDLPVEDAPAEVAVQAAPAPEPPAPEPPAPQPSAPPPPPESAAEPAPQPEPEPPAPSPEPTASEPPPEL